MNLNKLLYSITFLVVILFFTSAVTNNGGPGGGYSNAPNENNCTSCHGGSIVTSGNSNLNNLLLKHNLHGGGYVPDSTYTMEIAFKQSSRSKYGMQLTALFSSNDNPAGTLNTINSRNTKVTTTISGQTRQYIQHNSSGTSATGDSIKWQFSWKAPSTLAGKVKVHVVVMATDNNNGNNSGDIVYGKVFEIGHSPLLPRADATSPDSVTCQHQNIQVFGTGTNSPTSYSWRFTGANISTSTAQNPNVTFTSTSNTRAILTVRNSLGAGKPDTLNLTVKPSPTATISNGTAGSVCKNDSMNISATSVLNATYLWNTGSSNRTINIKTPGSYSVTVTSTTNGCSRTSAPFVLSNFSEPTAVLSRKQIGDSFCSNLTDSLFVTGNNIDSVIWMVNGVEFDRTKIKSIAFQTSASVQVTAITKSTNNCLSTVSNSIRYVRVSPAQVSIERYETTTSSIFVKFTKPNNVTSVDFSVNNGNYSATPSDSHILITGLNPNTNFTIRLRSNQSAPCFQGIITLNIKTDNCSGYQYGYSHQRLVCKGESLTTYLLDMFKYSKYSVSFNNGPFTTDTIFSFVPTSSDTLKVQIYDSLNPTCGVIVDKLPYTVNVFPTDNTPLTENLSICDSSYTYTHPVTYTSYKYLLNNSVLDVSASNSFKFNNLVSGDVVKIEVSNGACIKEFTRNITIVPYHANFSFTRDWKTYTFTANTSGLTTYTWKLNNQVIGNNNQSITYDMSSNSNSNINVSLSTNNSLNCSDTTSQDIQVPNFTGINFLSNNLIKIYPNPNQGQFEINSQVPGKIEIFNLKGQLVYSNAHIDEISQIELEKGLFILKFTSHTEVYTQKILVE